MGNSQNISISISVTDAQAKSGIASVNREFETLGKSISNIERNSASLTQSIAKMGHAAVALSAIDFSAGGLIRAADSWAGINAQLRIATGSAQNGATAYGEVVRVAMQTGQAVGDVATVYRRFAENATTLGVSQQQVAAVTQTVAQTIALSGGSAESSRAALVQFGQALASGQLRGEELNSVLEQSPRLARALADGLGVTIGGLRKLAENGEVTSEAILGALSGQAQKIDAEFGKLPVTIGRALTNLQTSFTNTIGSVEKSSGVFSGVASGIDLAARNMDTLAIAGAGVAAVFAGRLSGSIAAAMQSRIADAAATARQAQATLAATEATKAHIGMLLAEAEAAVASASGMQRLSVAQNTMIPLQARYAEAQAASTAAASAASIAAKAGSGVMAALGGPIGIVTTALTLGVTAWALWGEKADKATKEAATAAAENIGSVITKLEEMNGRIEETNRKSYDALVSKAGSELKTVRANIGQLQTELEALDAKGQRFSSEGKEKQALLNGFSRQEIDLQNQLGEARERASAVGTAALTKFINANAVGAEKVRVEQEKLSKEFAQAIANTGGVLDMSNPAHKAAYSALQAGLAEASSSLRKSAAAEREKAHKESLDDLKNQAEDELKARSIAAKSAQEAARARQAMTTTVDNLGDAYARMNAKASERQMSKEERELAAALREVEEQADRAREALSQKAAALHVDNISAMEAYRQAAIDIADAESVQMKTVSEAHKQRMRDNDDWRVGMKEAVSDYASSTRNVADTAKDAFTRAFSSMEDALVQFATTGKVNFSNLANSIIADMIRMQARQAMSPMLSVGSNWLSGLFGGNSFAKSGYSDLGSSLTLPTVGGVNAGYAWANGGVFASDSLHQYANTVQTSPKFFSFDRTHAFAKGGVFAEAGPEAVMPLTRSGSGRLGVDASGLSPNININVINQASSDTQVSPSVKKNEAGGFDVELIVRRVVLGDLTGNGPIGQAIGGRFGLSARAY